MIFERTTLIHAPLDDVFAFFGDPGNLAKITPPALGFQIVSAPGRALQQGDRIEYRIRVMGIPVRWVTQIVSWRPGHSFEDLQEKGPYSFWLHLHEFVEADGGTRMHDRVEYRLPMGILGALVAGWWVRRELERIFDFREGTMMERFGGRRNVEC